MRNNLSDYFLLRSDRKMERSDLEQSDYGTKWPDTCMISWSSFCHVGIRMWETLKGSMNLSHFWTTFFLQLQKHLNGTQRSKLTLSKSRLLATFNCKMITIKKIQSPKTKKNMKGRTLHDISHVTKKNLKGEDTSWCITQQANVPNGMFQHLTLRIDVKFLNDKRGKEKDRWCCRLYYWLNLS